MAKTAYHRIEPQAGSRIGAAIKQAVWSANDLQVLVHFKFNGREFFVFPGDTEERVWTQWNFWMEPEKFQEVLEALGDLA